MNNKTNNHNKRKQGYSSNLLQLLPIIIAVAIIPLIVLMKDVPTKLCDYDWYSADPSRMDFFLYYKSGFLMFIGAITAILLIYFCYMHRSVVRRSYAFIFLGIYAILVILSSLISKYRSFSIAGIPSQYESMFVLLTYFILCYYSFQTVRSEQNLKSVLKALLVSCIILIPLGIGQYLGHDFITSGPGMNLVTMLMKEKYDLTTNFGTDVYLTFYNPNYVGLYCSLLLPILLTLAFYSKGAFKKVLYLILCIGLVVCLIGSGSMAGLIALSFSTILLLILNRHRFQAYKKIILPTLLLFVIVGIVVFVKLDITKKVKDKLFTEPVHPLERIDTGDNDVQITYNHEVLKVSYTLTDDMQFSFMFLDKDNNDVPVGILDDQSGYFIDDSRYPRFSIKPLLSGDLTLFSITIDGREWLFTNNNMQSGYYYINQFGKQIKINNDAKHALPASMNSFATNRGYIWSTSIPLLKDHMLLGSGADSFIFRYPNDDYVGMYNYGFDQQVMTKPHSLYLQIGVQTGLVSLIAFLIFYMIYFVQSIILYARGHYDTFTKQIGAAIFISTVGFMIASITNDSTVTVSPIFWILLGIGYGLNQQVRQA